MSKLTLLLSPLILFTLLHTIQCTTTTQQQTIQHDIQAFQQYWNEFAPKTLSVSTVIS